jgi:hypothetical protein
MLFLICASSFVPTEVSADEVFVIIRIMDAQYPPTMNIYEDWNITRFGFNIEYQIENPTDTNVTISFLCAPFPFPRLQTRLVNKSLSVQQAFFVEWVAGEYTLRPGILNESYEFYFEVENHLKKSLPLGTYKIWFDYSNCSSCSVPVITEKLVINVSETNITYTFEYNNELHIVSSLNQTDYRKSFFVAFIFCFIILIYKRRRKNNI